MCITGPLNFLLVIPLFSFSSLLNSTYIPYALHGKSISGKRNESLQIQHLTDIAMFDGSIQEKMTGY